MSRRLAGLVMATVVLLLPISAAAQDVIEYYGTDAIGSVRIVFDVNGNVVGRMDYGPFGEQVTISTVGHKSYAGLFRDGEAGLDYAEARSYQVRTGRFSAPDPVYARLFDPQAWNRYAYALNSPLVFADPTGMQAAAVCITTLQQDHWRVTCPDGDKSGGGSNWNLGLFNLSGTTSFGQRGAGSGRTSEASGGRGTVRPSNTTAKKEVPSTPEGSGDAVIDVINGLGGLLDGLSLGIGPVLRTSLWGYEPVDQCSWGYLAGQDAAMAASAARLAYATTAETLRAVAQAGVRGGADAGAIASAAVADRNTLKVLFRFGAFPNTGMLNPAEVIASKGAAGAIYSAGKTHLGINVWAGLGYGLGGDSFGGGCSGR